MEGILQQVDGHFRVTLPWQHDPRYKLDNKVMAERRALFFEEVSYEELLRKYWTTMNDYIERRNAERASEEELNTRDKPVWHLPHYPVTHFLKPAKGEAGL